MRRIKAFLKGSDEKDCALGVPEKSHDWLIGAHSWSMYASPSARRKKNGWIVGRDKDIRVDVSNQLKIDYMCTSTYRYTVKKSMLAGTKLQR